MIKIKQRNLHLIFITSIFLILFFRDVLNVSINKYIILFYIVSFFIISPLEEFIAELLFIFPLLHGLPGTYIVLAATVIYLVKQRKHNSWAVVTAIFFIALESAAAIWYPTMNLSAMTAIVKYLSVLFIFIFLSLDHIDIDYRKCVLSYFLGVLYFCLIIVVSRITEAPSNWMSLFASGAYRFGELVDTGVEGIHLRANANELGYYSLIGFCIALFLFDSVKKPHKKWLVTGALFIVISGYLSLSRTWLILMALVIILYFVRQLRNLRRSLLFLVIFGVLFYLFYRYLTSNIELLAGFFTRFSYSNVYSLSNRIPILQNYWRAFIQNPRYYILGTGVTQYWSVIGINESMHNMIEQIIVCYGFLGAFIYFFIMGKAVLYTKSIRHTFESWFPLVGVLLFSQTIQFINPSVLMLPYVAAVYCLKIQHQD